jgi:hypothetical protein
MTRLRLEYSEGAVFFACSSHYDGFPQQAKNKALGYFLGPSFSVANTPRKLLVSLQAIPFA